MPITGMVERDGLTATPDAHENLARIAEQGRKSLRELREKKE